MRPRSPAGRPQYGDLERVARARQGDERAWAEIVRDVGPTLVGFARARGVGDPEDLMQDVLVAAAARLGSFEGNWRDFRAWVFSIAYRQVVNRYRAPEPATDLPEILVDTADSPEDQVVRSVMASEAVQALDVLTEVERDVVLLRVIAGLDTGEVAAAVGRGRGNVRVFQTRALAKLREELVRRGYTGSDHGRRAE
ncbi:MAG TPA: sigma-70 family RNA polymerase sigma factor [Acidimicrobiia bacterium]